MLSRSLLPETDKLTYKAWHHCYSWIKEHQNQEYIARYAGVYQWFQHLRGWDSRVVSLRPSRPYHKFNFSPLPLVLGLETMASCMLHKHSANRDAVPAIKQIPSQIALHSESSQISKTKYIHINKYPGRCMQSPFDFFSRRYPSYIWFNGLSAHV